MKSAISTLTLIATSSWILIYTYNYWPIKPKCTATSDVEDARNE